jgi:glycosyltransferase involved in cell wall biosynthesis
MVESFYSKTSVDYHLFIDNGSTDGTQEWLVDKYDHILLDKNYGIAYAFAVAVNAIEGYDYILKLDNDIEVVKEQLYPFIPLYPENTDVETRYDDKRKLCVTKSGNVMDIPRKTGDDHEIVLAPYNSIKMQNFFLIFGIIFGIFMMSKVEYYENSYYYELF